MDERISWCLRQKKGIKLVEPSDNLCAAYLEKANEALKSMQANMKLNLGEWTITTAYYAKYNAAYALLMKCGIKSEIHDCTVALVRYLFSGMLSPGAILDFGKSKEHRINIQYYVNKKLTEGMLKLDTDTAPQFVLEAERLASSLTKDKIDELRQKIKNEMRPV